VLINITASSQLGIHDVNEACNLIRAATQNDDCQINFGVVLDEKMGDKVKVTVIATGFQRDSLPEIDRRSPHFPFTAPVVPDLVSTAEPASVEARDAQDPAMEEMAPANDYELPAILRKQRRLVQ
jgi:cell division protein FtsZ